MIRSRFPFALLLCYGAVRAGFTAWDDDGSLRMLSEPDAGLWTMAWLAIAVASVPALIRPAIWGARALAAVTAAGVVEAWSWKVFQFGRHVISSTGGSVGGIADERRSPAAA
jgi:hypothetical protein